MSLHVEQGSPSSYGRIDSMLPLHKAPASVTFHIPRQRWSAAYLHVGVFTFIKPQSGAVIIPPDLTGHEKITFL